MAFKSKPSAGNKEGLKVMESELNKLKVTAISLSENQWAFLDKMAYTDKTSKAAIIRDLIQEKYGVI